MVRVSLELGVVLKISVFLRRGGGRLIREGSLIMKLRLWGGGGRGAYESVYASYFVCKIMYVCMYVCELYFNTVYSSVINSYVIT